ncbi:hypothetical protein ACVWXB_006551 [Streptomyces sp. TE12347]
MRREKRSSSAKATAFPSMTGQAEGWKQRGRRGGGTGRFGGKPRQCMGLYRTVLHEGLHDDLTRYLNQDLLLQLWPVLRTLVGRTVRTVWEDAFAQLASRTQAAA